MILVLEDDISNDSLKQLAEAYNKLAESPVQDDILIIYLDSVGGSIFSAYGIIDLINKHKDRTLLIAMGCIQSSAFMVFYGVHCARQITPDTYGMYHSGSWSIRVKEGTIKPDDFDAYKMKHMKTMLKSTLKFCKEVGFTDKEIEAVKDGKDVFFSYSRLNELLKNQIE